MKTKHLFLATALMASFAACTNEEIVSDVQQNVATGRPTVENVKLTFGENVDSRLVYNKGYKWESTDVIGALLMDNVNEKWHGEKATWQEKYTLTHHIHTSYPFTYNTEDKTWGTPAKMLEGNYFFAFPFESYGGQRQVAHSLIAQEQTGVGAEVRAESYAKNQFFIGYDRIVAGTQAEEALNNVTMTPYLGAIQLQIVNTGTQDYHINKVVLKGNGLGSMLTFNPSNIPAYYEIDQTGDNVTMEPVYAVEPYSYMGENVFNTANYLDLDEEAAWTLDKPAFKKYDKDEALTSVIKKVATEFDGFSQLYIKGTEEERLLEAEAGNTAYVLIMATPGKVEAEDLKLDIYTDEGVVVGIDLTTINKEIKTGRSTAITSAKVKEIGPNVVNTIKVQIDDNSFNVPTVMPVYNNDDLLQFIQWNANEVGAREVYAVLEKDVTLTAEMIEALAENKNIELFITGGHEITLAEDLEADVLDLKNLTIAAVDGTVDGETVEGAAPAIKVLGELALTKYSDAVGTITVAEGAELSIVDKQVNNVTIINEGTLSIGTKANIKDGKITNYAEMTVDADAYVKVEVENYGNIENNGTINVEGVANKKDAKITLGEDALLALASNEGLVITEDGAKVTGTNSATGRIEYVDGADVLGVSGGIIYREVKSAVTNEPVDANNKSKTNVNTWVLVGDATFAADAKITNVEIDGNYDITVADEKKLEIAGKLTIAGNTVTEGTIIAGSILVEEDAEWTNLGSVTATSITNKGAVDNKEAVYVPFGANKTPGDWEGNEAINGSDPNADNRTAKQKAMDSAVAYWASQWTRLYTGNETQYFNGNPYDFETFIACMNVNNDEWSGYKTALVAAYYKTLAEAELKMFGGDCEDFEPAEFKASVEAILKGAAAADGSYPTLKAAKKALIDDNTAGLTYGQFKNTISLTRQTEIFESMEDVRNNIAKQAFDTVKEATDFNTAMALWVISTAEIEAAITATENRAYWMLESDDIVAVARMWNDYDELFGAGWEFNKSGTEEQVDRLKSWFDAVYNTSKATWSDKQNDAWAAVKAYQSFIEGLEADEYTDAQVIAAGQSASN